MVKNEVDVNDEAYRNDLGESLIKIPTSSLLDETVEFLERYYKGCFAARIEAGFSGFIKASPLKFARMMKLIIKSSHRDQIVPITLVTARKSLTVSIPKDALSLSKEDTSALFRASEKSGFKLKSEAEYIILKAKFAMDKKDDIRALSRRIVYIYLQKEFEV